MLYHFWYVRNTLYTFVVFLYVTICGFLSHDERNVKRQKKFLFKAEVNTKTIWTKENSCKKETYMFKNIVLHF